MFFRLTTKVSLKHFFLVSFCVTDIQGHVTSSFQFKMASDRRNDFFYKKPDRKIKLPLIIAMVNYTKRQ